MNPALVAALIDLGIIIEPAVARLLAAGIGQLAKSIEAMNAPPTTAGIVMEIIGGVDLDHPDWSGETKRQWVADAVAQYITNHGGTPDAKAVNALVELGVQSLLGTQQPAPAGA